MIARGAMGNPWIFKQAAHILATGSAPPRPSTNDLRKAMLHHYEMLLAEKGRRYANLLFRKQTSYYAKYAPHPGALRRGVHEAGNEDDLAKIIKKLLV